MYLKKSFATVIEISCSYCKLFLVLQEIEKAKEMEGVPDEEGWITVTKHGKNKATPFTEARKKHLTYKERKKRKEKVFFAQECQLRNKFNFWNVHGFMNTWGLLQS